MNFCVGADGVDVINYSVGGGTSATLGTERLPLVDAEFAGGDPCVPGTLDPAIVAGKIVLCRRGPSPGRPRAWRCSRPVAPA
ncbi:MAG: hypothetical protein WBM50_17110 [Acidimicrobiales bacterium]